VPAAPGALPPPSSSPWSKAATPAWLNIGRSGSGLSGPPAPAPGVPPLQAGPAPIHRSSSHPHPAAGLDPVQAGVPWLPLSRTASPLPDRSSASPSQRRHAAHASDGSFRQQARVDSSDLKIQQRRVQWKEGVVMFSILHTLSLHNATPNHYTPIPLHPPLLNTQDRLAPAAESAAAYRPTGPVLRGPSQPLLAQDGGGPVPTAAGGSAGLGAPYTASSTRTAGV